MTIPNDLKPGKPVFHKGDIISIPMPDTRRWPRFKAWIQSKPPPIIIVEFKITAAEFYGAESFDGGLAIWVKRTVEKGEMGDVDLGFTVNFKQ